MKIVGISFPDIIVSQQVFASYNLYMGVGVGVCRVHTTYTHTHTHVLSLFLTITCIHLAHAPNTQCLSGTTGCVPFYAISMRNDR